MFKTEQGATYGLNQATVAKTDESVVLDAYIRSVSVLLAATITLSDAFRSPRIGDRHRVLATGGDATVLGGNYPLLGSGFVPKGTSADYELADSASGLVWVEMAGAGAIGAGEILVNKIVDVYNLNDAGLPANIYARPRSVDQPFELIKDSTVQADGMTIVNAKSTGAGPSGATALPGRWIRNEIPIKRWALAWLPANLPGGIQVDPLNGDNENDGSVAVTVPGTLQGPIKTVAEVCRRLRQAQGGKNYTLQVLNDVPATDMFRPSFLFEENMEDIVAAPANVAGNRQIVDMTVQGRTVATVLGSAVVVTFNPTTATDQATIDFGAGNAAFVAANVGQLIRISTGNSIGATAAIGRDLGTGKARISDFSAGAGGTFVIGDVAGSTIQAIAKTKWGTDIIQVASSQGRFTFNDFQFTAAPPRTDPFPTNDQLNLTFRNVSATFTRCLFNRVFQPSFGSGMTVVASAVVFPAITDVNSIGGAYVHQNTLMLRVNLRYSNGVQFYVPNGLYLEESIFNSVEPGTASRTTARSPPQAARRVRSTSRLERSASASTTGRRAV